MLRCQGTQQGAPGHRRDGHSLVHGHLGRPVSPHEQICRDKQRVGAGVVTQGWQGGDRAVSCQGCTRVAVAVQVGGTTQREAKGGGAGEGAVKALGGHRRQPLALSAEDEDLPAATVTSLRGAHGHVCGQKGREYPPALLCLSFLKARHRENILLPPAALVPPKPSLSRSPRLAMAAAKRP